MSFQNCSIVSKNTSADDYHLDKQSVERGDPNFRVSPSVVKEFLHCPARWVKNYNPPESDAKNFGSLLDLLILTPDQYAQKVILRPDKLPESVLQCPTCLSVSDAAKCRKCGVERVKTTVERDWSPMATVCRTWMEEHRDFEVLSPQEAENFQLAKKSMLDDEIIRDVLASADKQVLIRGEWLDKKTGIVIPVECLIDILPHADSEFFLSIFDMKCVNSGAHRPFTRKIHQFGWPIQAAFDLEMAKKALKRDPDHLPFQWRFIGCESYPPFAVYRKQMDENFLLEGQKLFHYALAKYAECLKTSKWPGYDDRLKNDPLCMDGAFSLCQMEPFMEWENIEEVLEQPQAEAQQESNDVPIP